MPVGTFDQAYFAAFKEVALPLMESFRPDVFFVELGADALAGDPLAHLELTNNVYADILGRVLKFDRPVLMVGGGGYNVENTVRAWALAWSVLSGQDEGENATIGLGGTLLGSTEWKGGLRDRELVIPEQQKNPSCGSLDATVARVKSAVFPIHGLKP